MKRILLFIAVAGLFLSCKQEMRYTQESAEIDAFKAMVAAYEGQDWEGFKATYADTAKLFHNTEAEGATIDEVIAGHKETLSGYSSYGFVEEKGDVEMVVTDKGETWVNFWGLWQGTMSANGKSYEIPVHLTAQWVDGKVVKEYGYWNMAEIMLDVAAMEAAAAEEAAGEMAAEQ